MSIKRCIFRLGVRVLEAMTLIPPPRRACHLSVAPVTEQDSADIITVAFNNAQLVPFQEQFLKKNITDRYTHIIVDNSTKPEVREEIYQYCLTNGIPYISMPHNWLNRVGGSYSHACALNYAYKHVIRRRKPYAFGYIDHDLFPVAPVYIHAYLCDQPVYGPLRLREECWYLSAIMSFFRYEYVQDKKVDFMPVTPYTTYLDSGGGNWYDIYSRLKIEDMHFPDECIEPLRAGGDRHGDSLEWFDNKHWLHTINGSCWKQISEGKDNLVKQLLDEYLKSC